MARPGAMASVVVGELGGVDGLDDDRRARQQQRRQQLRWWPMAVVAGSTAVGERQQLR